MRFRRGRRFRGRRYGFGRRRMVRGRRLRRIGFRM